MADIVDYAGRTYRGDHGHSQRVRYPATIPQLPQHATTGPRTIVQGMFIAAEGFIGLVEFSPWPDVNGDIILNIAHNAYLTKQLDSDTLTLTRGQPVLFDPATWTFGSGIRVGLCQLDGPDASGTIEFLMDNHSVIP